MMTLFRNCKPAKPTSLLEQWFSQTPDRSVQHYTPGILARTVWKRRETNIIAVLINPQMFGARRVNRDSQKHGVIA